MTVCAKWLNYRHQTEIPSIARSLCEGVRVEEKNAFDVVDLLQSEDDPS